MPVVVKEKGLNNYGQKVLKVTMDFPLQQDVNNNEVDMDDEDSGYGSGGGGASSDEDHAVGNDDNDESSPAANGAAATVKPIATTSSPTMSLSNLWLKCGECAQTLKTSKELVSHCQQNHSDTEEEVVTRTLAEHGMISCQLCGSLQERTVDSIISHCWSVHMLTVYQYQKQFPDRAFVQSPADKDTSRAACSISCPKCPDSSYKMMGIRSLFLHFKSCHEEGDPPPASNDDLLGLVADQLGQQVTRCESCGLAVSLDLARVHKESRCGRVTNNLILKSRNKLKLKVKLSFQESKTKKANYHHNRWQRENYYKCPSCTFTYCNYPGLKTHFMKNHTDMSEDEFDQRVIELCGLTSCRLCFTLRPKNTYSIKSHVKDVHKMSLKTYLEEFGKLAFAQPEAESAAVERLRAVVCPFIDRQGCQSAGAMTLVELRGHLFQVHDVKLFGGRSFLGLLALVANQVGLLCCVRCNHPVSPDGDMMPKHLEVCKGKGHNWMARALGRGPAPTPKEKKAKRDPAEEVPDELKVACPVCCAMQLSVPALKQHVQEAHGDCGIPEDYIERLIDEKGLLGCRLCGFVRRRLFQDWPMHLNLTHKMDLSAYLKATGADGPLEQTQEERIASELLLDMHCPRCGESGFGGLDGMARHLRTAHNVKHHTHIKYVGEVAEQLGLARCTQCHGAVLKGQLEAHKKRHVELRESNALKRKAVDVAADAFEASAQEAGMMPIPLSVCDVTIGEGKVEEEEKVEVKDSDWSIIPAAATATAAAAEGTGSVAGGRRGRKKRRIPKKPRRNVGDQKVEEDGRDDATVASHHDEVIDDEGVEEAASSQDTEKAAKEEVPASLQECLVELRMVILSAKCPFCPERFPSGEKQLGHVKATHEKDFPAWSANEPPPRQMSCGLCGVAVAAELDALQAHLKQSHRLKNMDCRAYLSEYEVCVVGFPTLDHPLVWRVCPWCGTGCTSMGEMREHAQEVHKGESDDRVLELMDALSNVSHRCKLCDEDVPMCRNVLEEHAKGKHLLGVDKYLELFYQDIRKDWDRQVLHIDVDKPSDAPIKQEQQNEPESGPAQMPMLKLSDVKGSAVRSWKPEEVDLDKLESVDLASNTVIDVIDLCDDDEEEDENNNTVETRIKDCNNNKGNRNEPNNNASEESPPDCKGFASVLGGIKPKLQPSAGFGCPKCKMGGFSSLALVKSHVERIHQGEA